MPTLTTTEHGEIHVPHRQVTRMADRLWRFGSPARRTAYVEKARRRLAAGPPRRSDAAIVLAAGEASASDRAQRVFEASTEGRNGEGGSFFVTQAQKDQLRERGYTDEQIREMKPEDAHRALGIVN
jgi:hypothetical protein